MEDLQMQLDSLKNKLHTLVEENKGLHQQLNQNSLFLNNKTDKEKAYLKQIHELEEENKKLKVVSAISGNEEYKKLMKLQLNKLIKEVDLCIMELKTN